MKVFFIHIRFTAVGLGVQVVSGITTRLTVANCGGFLDMDSSNPA